MSNSSPDLADLLKPQRNFAERAKPEHSDSSTDSANRDEYVACGLASIGKHPQMMLAVKKSNGCVEVYPYSMLTRIRSTNPDRQFSLVFHEVEISVKGSNLNRLFQYICEHRAREIVEADRGAILALDGECCVSSIE